MYGAYKKTNLQMSQANLGHISFFLFYLMICFLWSKNLLLQYCPKLKKNLLPQEVQEVCGLMHVYGLPKIGLCNIQFDVILMD